MKIIPHTRLELRGPRHLGTHALEAKAFFHLNLPKHYANVGKSAGSPAHGKGAHGFQNHIRARLLSTPWAFRSPVAPPGLVPPHEPKPRSGGVRFFDRPGASEMIQWNKLGASPPRVGCTDAGDAEADSMIGRFGRTARGWVTGGAVWLLLAALLAAPEIASARTYPVENGPAPEGDPTADDQPSPSPKNRSARFDSANTLRIPDSGPSSRIRGGRISWELYLRILSRLTLR